MSKLSPAQQAAFEQTQHNLDALQKIMLQLKSHADKTKAAQKQKQKLIDDILESITTSASRNLTLLTESETKLNEVGLKLKASITTKHNFDAIEDMETSSTVKIPVDGGDVAVWKYTGSINAAKLIDAILADLGEENLSSSYKEFIQNTLLDNMNLDLNSPNTQHAIRNIAMDTRNHILKIINREEAAHKVDAKSIGGASFTPDNKRKPKTESTIQAVSKFSKILMEYQMMSDTTDTTILKSEAELITSTVEILDIAIDSYVESINTIIIMIEG